jgi:hypothetical protein
VVVLLDRLVRQEDRLDQVIDRGAGADAGEVRPDQAAGAADGVALHAADLRTAVDEFAACCVAVLLHLGHERFELLRSQGPRSGG